MSARVIEFRRLATVIQPTPMLSAATVARLMALAHVSPNHTERRLRVDHPGWCAASSSGNCNCEPEIFIAGREN